jgi:2-keto-4-pentenoate hydratase/2-oxohepta-3-ene-1,7-dioic acid hydratase in catechol pathway
MVAGMRLATVCDEQYEDETLNFVHDGYVWPVRDVNPVYGTFFPEDMLSLLESGALPEMVAWFDEEGPFRLGSMPDRCMPIAQAKFAPLYRRPRKIWGIGLNYADHAVGLDEVAPTGEPASFMKPDTAIIGSGDTIQIPKLSEKTTGEAELGLIIGRECRDVAREEWLSAVAGYTTIIDMTAEDILRRNPRNLTQSKSFDTFFSFGPVFVSADEIEDVSALMVKTLLNGEVQAENTVTNMTFPPDALVSYHSQIMTLLPGDVISTGTPGAVALADGDVVGCEIGGVGETANPVVDLKAGDRPSD